MARRKRTRDDYIRLGVQLGTARRLVASVFFDEAQAMFGKTHEGNRALVKALDALDHAQSVFDDQYVADGLHASDDIPEFPMYAGPYREHV